MTPLVLNTITPAVKNTVEEERRRMRLGLSQLRGLGLDSVRELLAGGHPNSLSCGQRRANMAFGFSAYDSVSYQVRGDKIIASVKGGIAEPRMLDLWELRMECARAGVEL